MRAQSSLDSNITGTGLSSVFFFFFFLKALETSSKQIQQPVKTDTPRNSLQNIYFIVHNRLSYSIYRWPCLELKVKRKHSLIIPSHFMGRKKWGKKNKQASKRGQGCRNYHLHETHIPHLLIFLRLLHFCSFTNYKKFFKSTCLEFFKYQTLELKEPSRRSMSLPATWPAVPTLSPLCFTPTSQRKTPSQNQPSWQEINLLRQL